MPGTAASHSFLLIVSSLWLADVPAAAAEMKIIESNVEEFKVGTTIPESPPPELPLYGRIKVLLPSNETKVLEGPNPLHSNPRGPATLPGEPVTPAPRPVTPASAPPPEPVRGK